MSRLAAISLDIHAHVTYRANERVRKSYVSSQLLVTYEHVTSSSMMVEYL